MIGLLRGGLLDRQTQPLLRGPDVHLRTSQLADWKEWTALRAESQSFLARWEPLWPDDALSRDAFVRRVRRHRDEWRQDRGYSLLVFQNSTGRLVGGISLSHVRRGIAQVASMGYWVGQRYARRGYTSQAATLVLDFAFNQLKLHRIEAACLPENDPSRGLMEKIGMRREGYARNYLRINGRWEDHLLYAILADEFQPPVWL